MRSNQADSKITKDLVTFKEAFARYRTVNKKYDESIPQKTPSQMKEFVDDEQTKSLWTRISAKLKDLRYKSFEDLYLTVERVYRSMVNGSGFHKKFTSANRVKFSCPYKYNKATDGCHNRKCKFYITAKTVRDDIWEIIDIQDLSLHCEECFKVAVKNSSLFLDFIDYEYKNKITVDLENTLLKVFNIEYNAHSIQQRKYENKKTDEKLRQEENKSAFNPTEFNKLFELEENTSYETCGDNMKALLGLLTRFKKQDPGFVYNCHYVGDEISFLGLLWSSQKTLLGLYGDLLVVDSIHCFTFKKYHVINVTIVDNNCKSRYGAIAISMSDSTSAYFTLFEFLKKNVSFIRPPKTLIADGAQQIHTAFDQSFPGGNHVYCTFHLKKHIRSWFAGCENKDALETATKEGLFAKNPVCLEQVISKINSLGNDVKPETRDKVINFITTQSPCKQNYYTAESTASGRCEGMNGMLRTYGFKRSGGLIQSLTRFRDVINMDFHKYISKLYKPTSIPIKLLDVCEKEVLDTLTQPIIGKLKDQFELAIKGYDIKPVNDKEYIVTFNGTSETTHNAYSVTLNKYTNNLGRFIPTCDCSTHARGGYPCRHIISVYLKKKQKLSSSCFNDRFKLDQIPFLENVQNQAEINFSEKVYSIKLDGKEPTPSISALFEDNDNDKEEEGEEEEEEEKGGKGGKKKEKDFFLGSSPIKHNFNKIYSKLISPSIKHPQSSKLVSNDKIDYEPCLNGSLVQAREDTQIICGDVINRGDFHEISEFDKVVKEFQEILSQKLKFSITNKYEISECEKLDSLRNNIRLLCKEVISRADFEEINSFRKEVIEFKDKMKPKTSPGSVGREKMGSKMCVWAQPTKRSITNGSSFANLKFPENSPALRAVAAAAAGGGGGGCTYSNPKPPKIMKKNLT